MPMRRTKFMWIAHLLPGAAAGTIGALMDQGMAVMQQTLDRLAGDREKR